MDEDVEGITRSGGVLAEQPGVIRLGHGGEQRLGLADVFAANVDVGCPRAHRETGDQRAFDQLVRIVADDLAVLARTRLGLVGIDHQEARPPVAAFLGHERPFHAGGEAGPAASAQAGVLHLLDDRVLPTLQQRLGVIPVAPRHRGLQAPRLIAVEVGEDAVLVSEAHASPPSCPNKIRSG